MIPTLPPSFQSSGEMPDGAGGELVANFERHAHIHLSTSTFSAEAAGGLTSFSTEMPLWGLVGHLVQRP